MKTVIPKSDIRILKIASCLSVSGKSTLTYHIGCTSESDVQLRIYANTGAGFFSKEWLSLNTIQEAFNKAGKSFTSFALTPLFRGKSQNNTAFLLAVLLEEGLVKPSKEQRRGYECIDAGCFMAEVNALIDSKVSLNVDDKPLKVVKKKASSKTASDKKSGEQDSPL
ncbi:MAG TPA: hypothetical protein VIJ25_09870 [Methylococcales bacterium]